jgi:integrase
LEQAYRRLAEVRRLWAYRAVLPAGMRLPAAPPWGGEDSRELLGRVRSDADNRTRRIGERTMQLLLLWAIRFTENFADDILAAHAEHLDLHGKNEEIRRRPGMPQVVAHRPGELAAKVTAYLQGLRDRGEPLPGKRDESGACVIDWRHLSRIMNSASMEHTITGDMIRESGIPVGDDAPLDAPVTAMIDGQPWLPGRIGYHQAPELARLLSSACFVVISYLSGARAGEVLNLRRGCIERDDDNDLWLMRGLYFKGARDKDGSKLPEGETRRDPWVVIEPVARAISVLERLHPHQLLFPTRIEPYHLLSGRTHKRSGNARTDGSITEDLAAFTDWVNESCRRLGRPDAIPADRHGPLHSSRFRRTLAWFIRRRPRGLVAASIQYGHLHTRLLQGYAGSYESGFPDDYAFEDWLYRLEEIAEDQEALQSGEHVSGTAAEAYRQRVTAAGTEFAGLVLTSPRQARDLLGNPLLQVHHGDGMTCVLNPATAACQLRGAHDDPQVTPDEDDCRPRCPNLAVTDRDITAVRRKADDLEEIVADPLSPPIRHAREQHELSRLRAILDAHERDREPPAP